MLAPDENNYLAALYYDPTSATWGLAWADVSTGEFVSTTATSDKLASAILRCSPKEILLPTMAAPVSTDEASSDRDALASLPEDLSELLDAAIPHTCMRTYRPHESYALLPRTRSSSDLEALDSAAEQAAARAILDYVGFTQKSATSLVRAPLHLESSDHMIIDASAWKALELAKVRC